MNYTDVYRIAHRGYQRAAEDGGILRLIDEETGEPDTSGDSLAHAIIMELTEGVDIRDGDSAQTTLYTAVRAIEHMQQLLGGVQNSLMEDYLALPLRT